jgi:hypothetical protein
MLLKGVAVSMSRGLWGPMSHQAEPRYDRGLQWNGPGNDSEGPGMTPRACASRVLQLKTDRLKAPPPPKKRLGPKRHRCALSGPTLSASCQLPGGGSAPAGRRGLNAARAWCSPNQDSPGSAGVLFARGKQMRQMTPYTNRVTTTGWGLLRTELTESSGSLGALFMAPKKSSFGEA